MSDSASPPVYPPVYPHDPIEEIGQDVFMVRGSIKMNALIRITRNMAVIRHDAELTLVNPVRLHAAEEERLQTLGGIKRIMRLGPMHGVDDPYYVNTFEAEFWCQPGGTIYAQPAIDVEMQPDGPLPFPDAELFCFKGTVQPESALVLQRGNGLLLTCDAVQHYGDYKHNNLPARLMLPFLGFPKTTLVGPIWLKRMTHEAASLKQEFERLLTLDFDALLSAHGSFLAQGAKTAVRAAVERAFLRG
jgi:hypothetical protein